MQAGQGRPGLTAPYPGAQVTLLGVSKMLDKCAKGRKMQGALHPRVTYACLEERHFDPFVVTTQPYEQLSHAALAWLKENQHECQVLQVPRPLAWPPCLSACCTQRARAYHRPRCT